MKPLVRATLGAVLWAALGAGLCIAAGPAASGFQSVIDAATAMASVSESKQDIVRPRPDRTELYNSLYKNYRRLAEHTANPSASP